MSIDNLSIYQQALLDGLPISKGDTAELRPYREVAEMGIPDLCPLLSVVGQLGAADNKKSKYFQAQLLSLEKGISPTLDDASATTLASWEKETTAAYSTIPQDNYTLYHFLQAYGSRVATKTCMDASLFDRNRLLAAITSCMQSNGGQKSFLLFKGTVSGIQKYIYHNIKAEQIGDAEGSSKRLRGRSFLVSFINQVIAESIVEELGLEQANILMLGGGHFTILLPDNEDKKTQLEALLKKINLDLITAIGPQLSLLSTWVKAGGDLISTFGAHYSALEQQLDGQKQKKYAGYLREVFKSVSSLDTKPKGGQAQDEQLGGLVPYADYILEVKADVDHTGQHYHLPKNLRKDAELSLLSFLGKYYYILRPTKDSSLKKEWLEFFTLHRDDLKGKGLKMIALNNPDLLDLVNTFSISGLEMSYGFRFVGQETPIYAEGDKKEGKVMLFDDIADLKPAVINRAFNHKRLGAVRLDVDDLGAIFTRGLGASKDLRPERLLALSREFLYFFAGYFNLLAKKHDMYIVYSGGDDAFAIGSWLHSIYFVEELEQAFRAFTCKNEAVNFSAGILVCNPHYPIPRLAADAGELESIAKQYPADAKPVEKDKNALHLFNHTLSWADFRVQMDFFRDLDKVLPKGEAAEQRKIRRSMIRRFLRIINVHNDRRFNNVSGDQIAFERYRHIASLHGLLARHNYGERQIEMATTRVGVDGIIKELLQDASNASDNSQEKFNHRSIPLHMALYTTKTKK